LQHSIIESAARLVAPGGRLVYATCSFLREENEAQIERFLADAPDFTPFPISMAWRTTIGGKPPSAGDVLRLTPARHGTDGFFVAICERAKKAEAAPDVDPTALK
jgi:16S rRNA (cytosine967-C5)-methyltransferase